MAPASTAQAGVRQWWQSPAQLKALLKDLVLDELRRLRPGQAFSGLSSTQDAEPDAIALDSLERVQVASRIATFFQMREVGLEDNLLVSSTLDDWVAIVTQSLTHYDRAIGFQTSGSTGEPRVVVHPIDRLEREIAFWRDLLHADIKRGAAMLSLVPRLHIYGFLFTLLLPRALGVELIDARGWLPGRLARGLTSGSLIIGYPDFWRLLAADPTPLPAGILGITSTAPCPDSLARALVPGRLHRLIQIYGATETAGIGWRDSPDADYQLLPGWQRDKDGLVARDGTGGTRRANPPDVIDWRDAEHFRVLGRHDQAVAVAGINVYPERVARWLRQQPGVAHASVRLMRPDEGSRLKAFVVPAPHQDSDALRAQLLIAIERELQPMERPRALTFGASLPGGALGKAADWDCRRAAGHQE
jgi:4-coumarate--CoA ligase